jgi:hypothetical protein
MQYFTLLVFYSLSMFLNQETKSPHGPDFRISCSQCHSPGGWYLDKKIYSFDHNTTKLPLTGQHTEVDCRQCHKSLVFMDSKSECVACHNDIHQATVGLDCSRCHTPESWLVSNITEIHQLGRFPLLGAHKTADCRSCHKSESLVRFDVLGVECINCHEQEYLATTKPNHVQAGFSENCITCHSINAFQWEGAGFNHSFFPLVEGHAQPTCAECHTGDNYTSLSKECNSCHQKDYDNTTNPKHSTLGFPPTCELCHTLTPGWAPALYKQHDQIFHIYTGTHRGRWDKCKDCHTDPNNYSTANCKACHADAHDGKYTNAKCLECHK